MKVLILMPSEPCEYYSTDLTIDIPKFLSAHGGSAIIEIHEWPNGSFEEFIQKELKGAVYYWTGDCWMLTPKCEAFATATGS